MKAIKAKYDELNNPPLDADANWKRKRGREFEKLLKEILETDDLEPRLNYRPKGEEIDGSFVFGERVFLLEVKWHKDPLPASTIYSFKGKVDGKLQGTIGVFVSMSGYSEDAVDALTLGKTLNLILFDKEDIELAISENHNFKSVLRAKLRKAAESGVVYFNLESTQISYNTNSNKLESAKVETDSSSESSAVTMICEGKSDEIILQAFINRIVGHKSIGRNINIIVANGKMAAPRLAKSIQEITSHEDLIVVIDGDNEGERTLSMFEAEGIKEEQVIVVDPSIEMWLGMPDDIRPPEFYRNLRIRKFDKDKITELVDSIDIETLKGTDSEFNRFVEKIEKLKNT